MMSIASQAHAMSYRERVAWLSILAMAVTLGPYLVLTAIDSASSDAVGHVSLLIRFGTAASANALVLGAGHDEHGSPVGGGLSHGRTRSGPCPDGDPPGPTRSLRRP